MSRRKAEMVLELVDRATRPARRFMALQRRMGQAVERANRMARRSSRAAQRATDLYRRAVQGLARAQDALQRGIRRSNDLIRRQVTQMRLATGLMRGGVMGMGRAALLAGSMFTAYAGTVGLAAGSMLGVSRQFEKFNAVLTITEGSAEAARKAMGWVEKFAIDTPYELDKVMEAFVQLRAYGLDPTNGMLTTLGDVAAGMGRDLLQPVEAIADAITGENERLKELGITASKNKGWIEYAYTIDGETRSKRARKGDRAAIMEAILSIWNEKFSGAMELQRDTFDGMLSNIMDRWTKFRKMIMDSGPFDWMKSKLKQVLDTLDRMAASGELDVWAKLIGGHMREGLKAIWDFGKDAVWLFKQVRPWIVAAKDALGGWRNLALAVLAIPLRGVILATGLALLQFAAGAALAMKALAGIGFGSAVTGVLGFGNALLALANPLNWVKGAFIALRVALLSTGIGALAVGLAMAGMWIYNNWSGLKAFFKGFGEAFMKALGPARPLAERVIRVVRRLWDWIGRLVAPLDASAEQWAEWGRAAGRFVGDAANSVWRFVERIGAWFGNLAAIDWSKLLTLKGLGQAWNAVTEWISEHAKQLWEGITAYDWSKLFTLDGLKTAWNAAGNWLTENQGTLWAGLNPLNWGEIIGAPPDWEDTIKPIDWLVLLGGLFFLSKLIRPIVWTAKLVGAPIRWAALLGMFALKTLIKPIIWTAKLLGGAIGWAALLGGKFALSSLLTAVKWGAQLVSKVPWLQLAGGGAKFALTGLVTALKWGSRLIPGIGWALLAGELLWHVLVKPLGWDEYLNLETLRKLWTDSTTWLGKQFSDSWQRMKEDWDTAVQSWEKLPKIDWAELFNLQQMQQDWDRVANWFGNVASDLWNALPKINWSDLINFEALQNAWSKVEALVKKAEGWFGGPVELRGPNAARLGQAIGEKAATTQPPATIPYQPPTGSGFSNMFPGGIQEKAGGGSFNPGWLLTGEKGPELEYRTRGGFIAHNQALRSMLATSQSVARNAANSNRPQRLLRRAALAGGIAAATAVPAAAFDLAHETSPEDRAAVGARYLNERNAARGTGSGTTVTINGPLMTFTGNVDKQVLPDLRTMKDELLDELLDLLEDNRRSTRRWEHD